MITLAELSARMKATSLNEAALEQARLAAIALFETKTDRLWNRRTGHVFRDEVNSVAKNSDGKALWVPLYPIESIAGTEFYFDDEAGAEAIDPADIVVDLAAGQIRRASGRWRDVVTWIITGGYTDTNAPADVREALMVQAMFMYARNKPESVAVSALVTPQVGTTSFLKADMHPLFVDAVNTHFRRAY